MTTIQDLNNRLQELQEQGFDKSLIHIFRNDSMIKVGCSQCNALVINGIATHEHGCPNQNLHRFDELPEGV